jgi:hypothetical protein
VKSTVRGYLVARNVVATSIVHTKCISGVVRIVAALQFANMGKESLYAKKDVVVASIANTIKENLVAKNVVAMNIVHTKCIRLGVENAEVHHYVYIVGRGWTLAVHNRVMISIV